MKCKSNNNVTYSCKYHVVFCPKYRRPVLVDGVVDAYSNDNVMGVDLGIKCPAVSYCPDGSVKFYGNGRKNKYIRRHYNNLRKRFQKDQPGASARCLPTSMPQRPGHRGNFRTFVI